jgi:hypothetical protein
VGEIIIEAAARFMGAKGRMLFTEIWAKISFIVFPAERVAMCWTW